MGSHLSAVGFSKIKKRPQWDALIMQVVEDPTERYVTSKCEGEVLVEHFRSYGMGMGLIVRGTLDDQDEIIIDTCDPYIEAENILDVSEVEIEKKEDSDTYFAICEEEETGNEIIFHLQNVIDYLEADHLEETAIEGVKIVGLAVQGTIILPVEKDDVDRAIEEEQEAWYKELVRRARKGDEEAEELLDIQAEETAEIIRERLKNEDFLSVVEGYLLPNDEIEATYSILGTIEDIEEIKNTVTDEKVYRLFLNTMGVFLEVCVNEKDLTGIPFVGMRFMGTCWMQGKVILLLFRG